MPMIYDITDEFFRLKPPDVVDWENLKPGDGIGIFKTVLVLHRDLDDENHSEMIYYAASIGHNNQFRVYWSYGERNDARSTLRNGYKLRSERTARALFPQLSAYEFIYQ